MPIATYARPGLPKMPVVTCEPASTMLPRGDWCGAEACVPVSIPLHPSRNSIPCNSKHCTLSNRLHLSRNSIPCTSNLHPYTSHLRSEVS